MQEDPQWVEDLLNWASWYTGEAEAKTFTTITDSADEMENGNCGVSE